MRTALIIKSMSLLALLRRGARSGFIYQPEQCHVCVNRRLAVCLCCRWFCSGRQQKEDLSSLRPTGLPLDAACHSLPCQFAKRCYIASSP